MCGNICGRRTRQKVPESCLPCRDSLLLQHKYKANTLLKINYLWGLDTLVQGVRNKIIGDLEKNFKKIGGFGEGGYICEECFESRTYGFFDGHKYR